MQLLPGHVRDDAGRRWVEEAVLVVGRVKGTRGVAEAREDGEFALRDHVGDALEGDKEVVVVPLLIAAVDESRWEDGLFVHVDLLCVPESFFACVSF